jgi:sarcosine oxidase subunit alpha
LEKIKVKVNNEQYYVLKGSTVATAIFARDAKSFRKSVSGESRFPLCGMGICFECRVSINGVKHQRSCQILVSEGMEISTDE